ncbi:transposase [Planktothrix agardhii]|uniref:transposase n=2 Tax=Planktothrix agardhii TaxID=1160 RepID=UPI0020A75015|nr:transposase [Planktothrix agardhii]CAD5978994.1 Putative transposase in snaA-snaB intergenic region [Planktothrix agardhii]
MIKVTRTIKLKFAKLNRCQAQMFEQMTEENTQIANKLLSLPIKERRKMTTAKIMSELKSALVNQVIRHTTSPTGRKTKQYKVLPVEVNNQNWKLTQRGNTYSISFPTLKCEKRIPIEVVSAHWQTILDGLLEGTIQGGSFKLIKHRNKWYVYLSITEDVPEVETEKRLGCDRGQNNLAVVAPKEGFGKFFNGQSVKHRRRYFQQRRQQLQEAKKFRALKKWNKKEQRWMEAINHTISRRIVRFAEFHNADVVIEDLEGCRNTMKQRQKSRSDSGQSRHSWSYYSLEQKLNYKLALKGLKLIKRPAPYTSKSCSTCGVIGKRNRHDFNCPNGHYHNSDFNAARNLSQWDGFACDLNLKRDASVMDSSGLNYGVFGAPPNSVKNNQKEYIQLSLFDWARYENPTPLA